MTANPGCIIQIAQGLAARGTPVEVLHIVELLDQAYGGNGDGGSRSRVPIVAALRAVPAEPPVNVNGEDVAALPAGRRDLRHRQRVPASGRQPLRRLDRGRHRHVPAPRLGVRPAHRPLHDGAGRARQRTTAPRVENGAVYLEPATT